MCKSVATDFNEGHKSHKTGVKRGAGDEGDEDGEEFTEVPQAESLPISTTISTIPATTDQFIHTPEFRRHFVNYIPGDTLMTLRLATKGWKAAADALIREGVRSGKMLVVGEVDVPFNHNLLLRRHKFVTRVVFFLNITKVGKNACRYAANVVIVEIPEGVKRIGDYAFDVCSSLTTISFPTTLTSIGEGAFYDCTSLETVDLLHTNLQVLGRSAFVHCSELKSMTIPDSLQTLKEYVFVDYTKLVPASIDISPTEDDEDFDDEGPVNVRSRARLPPPSG